MRLVVHLAIVGVAMICIIAYTLTNPNLGFQDDDFVRADPLKPSAVHHRPPTSQPAEPLAPKPDATATHPSASPGGGGASRAPALARVASPSPSPALVPLNPPDTAEAPVEAAAAAVPAKRKSRKSPGPTADAPARPKRAPARAAGGASGSRGSQDRPASNASKATGPQPNILFLFPDSWRYDFDGYHAGIPVRLPNLRRIAEQGVRFTHAACPSPLCTPSRSALVSGREYDRCGVPDNAHNYPLAQTTFYTQLQKAGYKVMSVGKDDLSQLNAGWAKHEEANARALGFSQWSRCFGKMDTVRVHGHNPWEIYGKYLDRKSVWRRHKGDFAHRINDKEYFNFEPTFHEEEDYQDNWIGRIALDFLQQPNLSSPWFLQVNYAGPHPPLDVTERMKTSVQDRQFAAAANSTIEADSQLWMRRLYGAQIENIDQWTGKLVDHLASTSELERTIVCVSSDHGEMLGDHTVLGKESPFQGSVGVPLVCSGPGFRKGLTVDAPVTILDLAATFMHYGRATPARDMAAVSLHDVLQGDAPLPRRTHVLSGFGYFRTVTRAAVGANGTVEAVHKLMCCKSHCHRPYHTLHWKRPTLPQPTDPPTVLLFDLLRDPHETADLRARQPQVVADLADYLKRETGWDCFKSLGDT